MRNLTPLLFILSGLLVLFLIFKGQEKSETKKEIYENILVKTKKAIIERNEKYIAEIERLNALLADCQKTEQNYRANNQKAKTQIIKVIHEKVSNNPTPADKELLRDLSNLAELISTARNADTITR